MLYILNTTARTSAEVCRWAVVELSKYISCSIALNKNMMLFNKGIRLFVACQLFHLVNKSAAAAQVVCVVKKCVILEAKRDAISQPWKS
jgi:hypothetical protein